MKASARPDLTGAGADPEAMVKRIRAGLVAAGLALLVAQCAPTPGAPAAGIVVASKLDTEGGVLGNIILQALQARGLPTVDKIQLGATAIVRQALIEGQIDVYPEYTGNAAFFFGKADLPVWKDPEAAYRTARDLDRAANDLVWLTPASANNTWAIAVRQEIARAAGLRTMSDFGRYVAGGGAIRLAASSEFVTSPGALPAFGRAYGFTLRPDQLVILAGGDTAATIAAAARGTSGTNAAMVFGTDGSMAVARLVMLDDDKGVQPVYQPAPLVRGAVLKAHPEIAAVLDPIFRRLDLATLRDLNGRVQIGGEPASAVAADFLRRARRFRPCRRRPGFGPGGRNAARLLPGAHGCRGCGDGRYRSHRARAARRGSGNLRRFAILGLVSGKNRQRGLRPAAIARTQTRPEGRIGRLSRCQRLLQHQPILLSAKG